MKKLKLFTVPVALLCLTGCSAGELFKSPKPDFCGGYTVCADISCGEFEAAADIIHSSNGGWEFSFTEPDYLSGMKLTITDKGMTAELDELSVSTEPTAAYATIPDIIAKSVNSLADIPAESISAGEKTLTITTEAGGCRAMVTTTDKGELMSLKCPGCKLVVEFTDYQPLTPFETNESDDGGGIEII